jgi:phage terminase large subunit-like protein
MKWTTACPDWADRLVHRRSIIPPPIYPDQAEQALAIFRQLRVVDLPRSVWDDGLGAYRSPNFGECSEQWVFDFVAAIFGAYDAETGKQLIREFYLLISKKNTKSTIAAGIMLTALILCWRDEEEHLILAPTKEVADNSFKPAAAMVRADDELLEMFHVQDHVRTITHRVSRALLKVVAADTDTVSGKKSGRVLVDEHWLFGTRANADAMFMEATGGQISREEGWVIYLTTQSEDPPAGVFKDKLNYYRDVRDGKIDDKKSLGVLYEFPLEMIESKAYLDPANFYITNPNIGRSVSADWLEDELRKQRAKADGSFQKFLAKHLNVEIGLNLRSDRWAGADFWEAAKDAEPLELDDLIRRSEVVVVGIDGGGLDDLLGLVVLGREHGTRRWLIWVHGWAHEIVLKRRQEIAPALKDFEKAGDLTIVAKPGEDVAAVADIVCRIRDAKLLPEKNAIGVDSSGIGDIVDELTSPARGIPVEMIIGIRQGWTLNGAIKTAERKLAGGEMAHAGQAFMAWCVSNARIEQRSNGIVVTKQASGTAKIDPVMALFDAVSLMMLNPEAKKERKYQFMVFGR